MHAFTNNKINHAHVLCILIPMICMWLGYASRNLQTLRNSLGIRLVTVSPASCDLRLYVSADSGKGIRGPFPLTALTYKCGSQLAGLSQSEL